MYANKSTTRGIKIIFLLGKSTFIKIVVNL